MQSGKYDNKPIPHCAGIGLRAKHYQEIIDNHPDIGWFEVHTENYFGKGGKPHYYLDRIRQNYPLSFHGVGLSLGSAEPLNIQHLNQLKNITDRYLPAIISEHLCWSSIDGTYFNDLLPLPYTDECLDHIIDRISQVQEFIKRQILIENITAYVEFNHSTIPEYEFLNILAEKTGCGILLDINNLYINSVNLGWNTQTYLENISAKHILEIHLAGFNENSLQNGSVLIDAHNNPVSKDVWKLYAFAIQLLGKKPTLIEWDKNLPPLEILLSEAHKVNKMLESTDVAIA